MVQDAGGAANKVSRGALAQLCGNNGAPSKAAASARRSSLGTESMHKLAVWAKQIMKAKPSDSEMCLNQTNGDIRSAVL